MNIGFAFVMGGVLVLTLAFVLWGAYAQKKAAFVDKDRHLVLQSPHPSPREAGLYHSVHS